MVVFQSNLVRQKQGRKSSASQDNPSVGKSTKPLPKVPNPPTRCQKTLKYGDKKCVPACVRVCHVYKPGLEQFCHELLRPSAPPFPGPPGWWVGAPSLVILIYKCALELSIGGSYTGWFFLTGPPDFQYQNEKTCSANEELFYIENFVKN